MSHLWAQGSSAASEVVARLGHEQLGPAVMACKAKIQTESSTVQRLMTEYSKQAGVALGEDIEARLAALEGLEAAVKALEAAQQSDSRAERQAREREAYEAMTARQSGALPSTPHGSTPHGQAKARSLDYSCFDTVVTEENVEEIEEAERERERQAAKCRATEGVRRSGGLGPRMQYIDQLIQSCERGDTEPHEAAPSAAKMAQAKRSMETVMAAAKSKAKEAAVSTDKARLGAILRELYEKDQADMSPAEVAEFERRTEQLCKDVADFEFDDADFEFHE